jgi:molecular chaperone DnaK
MVIQRLKDAAEKAKIELSNVQETTINLPFLTADASGPKHLQKQAQPREVRAMIARSSSAPSSRCRRPRRREEDRPKTSTRSSSSVARPASRSCRSSVKEFFGKEPHKGVNPDEVVAIGAAVQAGVLSGDVKDIVLLDVTPLSLGVETLGGVMTVMIPRNTTIPTQKKEIFSTAATTSRASRSTCSRASAPMARYNRTLGKLPPRGHPAGAPRRAEDRGHLRHRRQRHPLGPRQGQGDGQGSEDHHHRELGPQGGRDPEDGARRARARGRGQEAPRGDRARNKLDTLCYTIEKTLDDNKDKIPEADAKSLKDIIVESRAAIEKQDDEAITASLEKLEKEAHKIAGAMYGQAGPGAPGGPGDGPDAGGGDAPPAGGKNKDGVIDAEFEEAN